MGDTPRPPTISTILQRITQQAIPDPAIVFTTLAHLMDVDCLREAYRRTSKDAAPGSDGVTAAAYAEHLEANLTDLYERLSSGRYTAPPVKRTWLDKEDGSQRPIARLAFKDKIVQRSVTMLLGAVHEQDVQDFSHGFREGHSPHQALQELREQCMALNIGWIVDADVRGFFDRLDHGLLQDVIRNRVNDGGIWRLLGKWLHTGVLEGEHVTYPEKGTPQGGVCAGTARVAYSHRPLADRYPTEDLTSLVGPDRLVECGKKRYGWHERDQVLLRLTVGYGEANAWVASADLRALDHEITRLRALLSECPPEDPRQVAVRFWTWAGQARSPIGVVWTSTSRR